MPFITAGYPDIETTLALLNDIEARGVRVCELGVPFSDPIADGPTIQASYSAALEAGVCCEDIFKMVRRYRDGGGAMALVAMVSYSIVFRRMPGPTWPPRPRLASTGLSSPTCRWRRPPSWSRWRPPPA